MRRVIAAQSLAAPVDFQTRHFTRFFIRIDKLPYVPADAAGKLRWAGSGIPMQPWLLGALGGPSYVARHASYFQSTFSLGYM